MPSKLSSTETEARTAIGQRIRQNRLDAGLSLEETAHQVTALTGAVPPYDRRHAAKWESGCAPISPDLLKAIAKVLATDTWSLAWTPPTEIPFRARLLHVSSDRCIPDALLRRLQGALEFEIRSWVEFTYRAKRGLPFRRPVVFHRGCLDVDGAESLAVRIRRQWELGTAPIADVVQTLEDTGFVFRHVDWDPCDHSSPVVLSGMLHGRPGICWSGPSPLDPAEAAQYRLRILTSALHVIALRKMPSSEAIRQAHDVATAMLLPRVGMSDRFGGSCNSVTAENVLALAGRYGLPPEGVIERLVQTATIDDAAGHRLARSVHGLAPIVRRETSIRVLLQSASSFALARG